MIDHLAVDGLRLRTLDVEAMAASVYEVVEQHEAVDLLGGAAGHDGRDELGRVLAERGVDGVRHEGVVRLVHMCGSVVLNERLIARQVGGNLRQQHLPSVASNRSLKTRGSDNPVDRGLASMDSLASSHST